MISNVLDGVHCYLVMHVNCINNSEHPYSYQNTSGLQTYINTSAFINRWLKPLLIKGRNREKLKDEDLLGVPKAVQTTKSFQALQR